MCIACLECECDCQRSPLVHNSLFVPCLECECDCQQSPLVHNSLFVPWPIATAHTACCICEQPYVYICTCMYANTLFRYRVVQYLSIVLFVLGVCRTCSPYRVRRVASWRHWQPWQGRDLPLLPTQPSW